MKIRKKFRKNIERITNKMDETVLNEENKKGKEKFHKHLKNDREMIWKNEPNFKEKRRGKVT